MKRFLVALALVVAPVAGAFADDQPKNPWGSFAVGSWVKNKTHSVVEMAGSKTETTTESTTKIIDKNDEEVTLETESTSTTVVAGNEVKSPPQKTSYKYPLKAKGEHPKTEHPKSDVKPETGDEEVEAAGKKLKCKWLKFSSESGGSKTTSKSWTCEDVPGFSVKNEVTIEGAMKSTTTTELLGFEVK